VMASGRPNGVPTTINQLSFRVKNLEDLKRFFTVLVAEQAKEIAPRNHGKRLEHLFQRPGGQPHRALHPSRVVRRPALGKPLDLTEPVETIVAKTETLIRDDPTACPREAWMTKLKTRLAREPGRRVASLRLALAAALASPLSAQDYPKRPIRFMIGFAPGGSADIVSRAARPDLAERLGQPVIAEQKSGRERPARE